MNGGAAHGVGTVKSFVANGLDGPIWSGISRGAPRRGGGENSIGGGGGKRAVRRAEVVEVEGDDLMGGHPVASSARLNGPGGAPPHAAHR